MKKLILLVCTLFVSTTIYANNCDAVKEKIAEKIKANGVVAFTLEAVDKGTVTDKKVVGGCGGGTKDIVYQRGAAVPATEQTQSPTATTEESMPNVTTEQD